MGKCAVVTARALSSGNQKLLRALWRLAHNRKGVGEPLVLVSAAVRLDALAGYVEIVEDGPPRLCRFTERGLREVRRE